MSLLLDALKRAEQEKLAKQGERPANDAPRAHAPSPAAMPHREPANALSSDPCCRVVGGPATHANQVLVAAGRSGACGTHCWSDSNG